MLVPSGLTAQPCVPALSFMNLRPPATAVGTMLGIVEPLPRRPSPLAPQQYASRAVVRAHDMNAPASTAATLPNNVTRGIAACPAVTVVKSTCNASPSCWPFRSATPAGTTSVYAVLGARGSLGSTAARNASLLTVTCAGTGTSPRSSWRPLAVGG